MVEEHRHARSTDAARAGADLLAEMLAERGTSYDQFVWSLTNGAHVVSRLRRATRETVTDEARYRAVVQEWLATSAPPPPATSRRVPMSVPGSEDMADVAELRDAFNLLLDRTDAYVRESAASLDAAAEGRYHRRSCSAGMSGSTRVGGATINAGDRGDGRGAATRSTRATGAHGAGRPARGHRAARAEQLAAASTELSATSAGLSEPARHAVGQANLATPPDAASRGRAGDRGRGPAHLRIAAQTQLLALNATIEAARAGDAGPRASPSWPARSRSSPTRRRKSTEQITEPGAHDAGVATQAATGDGLTSRRTIRDMSPMADAVRIAVDGSTRGSHDGYETARSQGWPDGRAAAR